MRNTYPICYFSDESFFKSDGFVISQVTFHQTPTRGWDPVSRQKALGIQQAKRFRAHDGRDTDGNRDVMRFMRGLNSRKVPFDALLVLHDYATRRRKVVVNR